MAPEIANAGLADFLAAYSPLLASLHAQVLSRTQAPRKPQAARWDVSRDEFAAALYRSATHHFGAALPAAPTVEGYLRALHFADLALACALLRGSEAAWAEFVAEYRPVLYSAARAIVGAAGEAQARDLADSLYAELYGVNQSARNRRPLLEYFHGRSKLATWLRAVLAQRFVDSLRVSQRLQPLDDAPEQIVPPRGPISSNNAAGLDIGGPDRQRLLPHLREAFADSLAALAAPDRLLLSLYYVQELTLAQIARLRGVHEATISRQLERLRRELRADIERTLSAARSPSKGRTGRTGLSSAEIQLCFSYALEDWPFDLGSVLLPNALSSPTELSTGPNAQLGAGDSIGGPEGMGEPK